MFVATIDQKALLFYIAAASINALLIMTFLAYPTLDGPTIWKKLSFFTNFNQLCVAFFYLYRLVSHIDLPRRNNQAASAIHSMLLVLGAVITAFFWITYAINPHILLSKRALDVIPFWLLFAFHGGNFIFLLIEYLLVLPPTQNVDYDPKPWLVMASTYLLMQVTNYLIYERFPYPFQKYIGPIENFCIMAAIFGVMHLLQKLVHPLLTRFKLKQW